MTQSREPPVGADRAPFLHPRDLLAAIGLLTIVPLQRPDPKRAAFAQATLFFPLVGLLMGFVLAALNWRIAHQQPNWVISIVLVGVWELLGRAEALRAVGAVWNGHAERPAVGVLGVVAMAAIVLTKIVGLSVQGAARTAALLFAPTLARWSMVVLATGARDADAPGQKFSSAVTFREFALTSVFTLAVVFSVAEAVGIVIVVCVAGVTLGMRLSLHRWAGGVSWRWLLVGAQLIETWVVVLLALL